MLKVQQSYLALFTQKKKYKKHCSLIYNLLLSLQNQLGKVNKQQQTRPILFYFRSRIQTLAILVGGNHP